jgi:cysteine desulfurase
MKPIYLDYNATTPIDPRVADAMEPYLREHFGNPSSGHMYGQVTNEAVTAARAQVADLLECRPDEIVFTSGGTEANNHAIGGLAHARRDRGNHIITSAVEHPAVSEVCRHLARAGFEITTLPVDGNGMVDPADLQQRISSETTLVTIMHANNEVGTIQPIAELAAIAREHGAIFHSDCAQSAGKISIRTGELGADMISLAGHKLYAPKGIGVLFVRAGINLVKLMHGADHEMNRRAGTENILGIIGLGAACEIAARELEESPDHLRLLRDRLQKQLIAGWPELVINGHPDRRLPNTLSASFPGLEAGAILGRMAGKVAASSGAACHADGVNISAVLGAMKIPLTTAMGTLRLSVGRFTTADQIDLATAAILTAAGDLR